jgi:hypothetical protein
VEEVGSLEVGWSGKVSLSEKVVLVLLAVEASAVKEGSGFLPLRRVFGCAITVCAITRCAIKAGTINAGVVEVDSRLYCQGGCKFLKQVKGVSASLRLQTLFIAIVAGRVVTGVCGSGSVSASQAEQVWIRSIVCLARSDLGSLHS